MAKPILYYALVGGYSAMGHGLTLIGVTSQSHGKTYGRDERDYPTSRADRDVIHRFTPDQPVEFCKAAGDRATKARELLSPSVQEAYRAHRCAEADMNAKVLAAAKGEWLP